MFLIVTFKDTTKFIVINYETISYLKDTYIFLKYHACSVFSFFFFGKSIVYVLAYIHIHVF